MRQLKWALKKCKSDHITPLLEPFQFPLVQTYRIQTPYYGLQSLMISNHTSSHSSPASYAIAILACSVLRTCQAFSHLKTFVPGSLLSEMLYPWLFTRCSPHHLRLSLNIIFSEEPIPYLIQKLSHPTIRFILTTTPYLFPLQTI